MSHLTNDEIINFVSFSALTEENIALAAKVNEHIFTCVECFNKVREYQERNETTASIVNAGEEIDFWESESEEDRESGEQRSVTI